MKQIPQHIKDKRDEIIYALSLQDYTYAHISLMFNIDRTTVMRIVRARPADYQPKWVKRT